MQYDPNGNVEARIDGNISGQVAVGENIIQVGSVHGSTVNITLPENRPAPRPRPSPVILRPHESPDILDREEETGTATTALRSSRSVEFCGPPGIGKSVLLRKLAFELGTDTFPDGIVNITGYKRAAGDFLQQLFERFYECKDHYKATEAEVQHAFQNKRALVFVDDLELSREDTERVMNIAPACTFVLASSERRLWGEGCDVMLPGLPPDAAVVLLARSIARPLEPNETSPAQRLCSALKGHPLSIIQAGALVRDGAHTLPELAVEIAGPDPERPLMQRITERLTGPGKRIAAVLAALAGTPVHAENLSGLAEVPEIDSEIRNLEQKGLVQVHERRCKLTGMLADFLHQTTDLNPWKERAADYYAGWAEEHIDQPSRIAEEADAMAAAQESAGEIGRWSDVIRLSRPLDSALALSGNWDLWNRSLDWTLRAARAVGDRSSEAWALHELGTRALGLGDNSAARELLNSALRIRQSMGDEAGAAATSENLSRLPELPPAPEPPPTSGTPTVGGMSSALKGTTALLAVVTLAVVGWMVWRKPASGTLAVSSSTLEFGEVKLGDPAATRPLVIRNDGKGDLSVTLDDLTEPFKISAGRRSFTLGPSEVEEITVSFAPDRADDFGDELRITYGDRKTLPVPLTGSAVAQRLGSIAVSETEIRFPATEIGSRSDPRTLTISNKGNGVLTGRVPPLGPPFAVIEGSGDFRLNPGSPPHEVVLVFAPRSAGAPLSTKLTITSSDPEHPKSPVELAGTGRVTQGRIKVSPEQLTFRPTPGGDRSEARPVSVENVGDGILRGKVPKSVAPFEVIDGAGSFGLRPGAIHRLRIVFHPETEGRFIRELVISSSDPDGPKEVKLSGSARAKPIGYPDLAVENISLEKVSVPPPNAASRRPPRLRVTAVVRNVGGGDFESAPGQAEIRLLQDKTLVSKKVLTHVPVKGEISVAYDRDWPDNAVVRRGSVRFPSFQAVLVFDPDIRSDGNPRNDDSNARNNSLSIDSAEVEKRLDILR